MAAAFSIYDRTIILTPFFEGSNTLGGGIEGGSLAVLVVDLLIKEATTKVFVKLKEHTRADEIPQKMQFTCVKNGIQTHPSALKLSIDQIKNLTIRIGIFEKGAPIGPRVMDAVTGKVSQQQLLIRSDEVIPLVLPERLESYEKYRLTVSSDDFKFTARMEKEEAPPTSSGGGGKPVDSDYLERMRKMGEVLMEEGVRNLERALSGGFNDLSNAEAVTHITNGVINAGKEMNPALVVPDTNISEKPADLNRLSIEELKKRFEAAFIQDKKNECDRHHATIKNDTPALNEVIAREQKNSKLLMMIAEALEKKGIEPKIPKTEEFLAVSREADRLQKEVLKLLKEKLENLR